MAVWEKPVNAGDNASATMELAVERSLLAFNHNRIDPALELARDRALPPYLAIARTRMPAGEFAWGWSLPLEIPFRWRMGWGSLRGHE